MRTALTGSYSEMNQNNTAWILFTNVINKLTVGLMLYMHTTIHPCCTCSVRILGIMAMSESSTLLYHTETSLLTVEDVLEILSNIDVKLILQTVARRPVVGSAFTYDYMDPATHDDWFADGYQWINYGN
jgi:hypothetical protein